MARTPKFFVQIARTSGVMLEPNIDFKSARAAREFAERLIEQAPKVYLSFAVFER